MGQRHRRPLMSGPVSTVATQTTVFGGTHCACAQPDSRPGDRGDRGAPPWGRLLRGRWGSQEHEGLPIRRRRSQAASDRQRAPRAWRWRWDAAVGGAGGSRALTLGPWGAQGAQTAGLGPRLDPNHNPHSHQALPPGRAPGSKPWEKVTPKGRTSPSVGALGSGLPGTEQGKWAPAL